MLIEVLNNSGVRQRMISLERQQVVASARQDLFGDRGLAAHRIQRHDAVLQGELVQQRRNGGNLVRLAIDAALAQHQALLTGPGAHQVQGRLLASMVERAPQRLAINGDHLALKAGHERADPGREPGLKGVGIDEHEHAPERVVRGNAVRQLQERPEPGQLTAAIQRDVAPAFSTGNHRTHRNHQDVEQAMPDLTGAARVLDRTKILRQVFDRHALFLRRREDTSSRVSAGQTSKISCVAPDARIGVIHHSRRAAYIHYPQVDSHESEQLSEYWLLHSSTNAPTKTEGQLWPTNKTPILCKNLVRETQPRSRRAVSL